MFTIWAEDLAAVRVAYCHSPERAMAMLAALEAKQRAAEDDYALWGDEMAAQMQAEEPTGEIVDTDAF